MSEDKLIQEWKKQTNEWMKGSENLDFGSVMERKRQLNQGLRPFMLTQLLQFFFGLLLVLGAGGVWFTQWKPVYLMPLSVTAHLYGGMMMAFALYQWNLLKDIDFTQSVVYLQKQLLHFERIRVIHGMLLGLPWWFLWIPVAIAVMTHLELDAQGIEHVRWISANIVFGVLGCVGVVALYWWARRRQNQSEKAQRIYHQFIGMRLSKLKHQLAMIEDFDLNQDGSAGN